MRQNRSQMLHPRHRASAVVLAGLFGLVVLPACSGDDSADGDSEAGTDDETSDAAEAAAELAALEARLAELDAELDSSQAEVATLTGDVEQLKEAQDALNADLDTANAALAAAVERADTAEERLSAFEELFPVRVDSSVEGFDLIGRYSTTFSEAFCGGLPDCGAQRPGVEAQITQGDQGLILTVPGMFTAGLLGVDGGLTAGTDTDQMMTCDGAPRIARVIVTLFSDGVTIEADGSRRLDQLGASIFVQAQATETCPAADLFLFTDLARIA